MYVRRLLWQQILSYLQQADEVHPMFFWKTLPAHQETKHHYGQAKPLPALHLLRPQLMHLMMHYDVVHEMVCF